MGLLRRSFECLFEQLGASHRQVLWVKVSGRQIAGRCEMTSWSWTLSGHSESYGRKIEDIHPQLQAAWEELEISSEELDGQLLKISNEAKSVWDKALHGAETAVETARQQTVEAERRTVKLKADLSDEQFSSAQVYCHALACFTEKTPFNEKAGLNEKPLSQQTPSSISLCSQVLCRNLCLYAQTDIWGMSLRCHWDSVKQTLWNLDMMSSYTIAPLCTDTCLKKSWPTPLPRQVSSTIRHSLK